MLKTEDSKPHEESCVIGNTLNYSHVFCITEEIGPAKLEREMVACHPKVNFFNLQDHLNLRMTSFYCEVEKFFICCSRNLCLY